MLISKRQFLGSRRVDPPLNTTANSDPPFGSSAYSDPSLDISVHSDPNQYPRLSSFPTGLISVEVCQMSRTESTRTRDSVLDNGVESLTFTFHIDTPSFESKKHTVQQQWQFFRRKVFVSVYVKGAFRTYQ